MAETVLPQPVPSIDTGSDATIENNNDNTSSAESSLWTRMVWMGERILAGMEYVGEGVAGVLGLDESRFQYVLDGMDREDWEQAVATENARRAAENIPGQVSIETLAEDGLIPEHTLIAFAEEEEGYRRAEAMDIDAGDRMERGEQNPGEMELVPSNSNLPAGVSSSSTDAPSSGAHNNAALSGTPGSEASAHSPVAMSDVDMNFDVVKVNSLGGEVVSPDGGVGDDSVSEEGAITGAATPGTETSLDM